MRFFTQLTTAACLLASISYSQKAPQLPNIIGPSPTSAAFDKFSDSPVSHFTGVPNIDIPLYNLKIRDASV